MSNQCGDLEFVRGGTIVETHIDNSQMSNSSVTSSTIQSSDIVALASIDPASAQVVADAIARLSPAQLKAVAEAIHNAHSAEYGKVPTAKISNNATLPTQICGSSRDMLLGTPDAWEQRKDGLVSPLYRP